MGVLDNLDQSCYGGVFSACILEIILGIGISAYKCLPIIVILADVCSAFRKRKHWIPGDSLVLGALALQFLALLKSPFHFSYDFYGDYSRSSDTCERLYYLASDGLNVQFGNVSVCVLMGCLLPGVARPFSASLWRDMAALFISSSVFLFQISYEAQLLHSAFNYLDPHHTCEAGKLLFYSMQLANAIIIVSTIFLLLTLGSAALASVTIPQFTSAQIPTIFPPPNLNKQFRWEKVEEQVSKSWIVVRTADPQYVITRSCLTSSVALIITACNALLVSQILLLRKHFMFEVFYSYLGLVFLESTISFAVIPFVVIVMGSLVIYWRCITQVVYYPISFEWTSTGFSQYFQIERFWVSHLLGLMRRSRGHTQLGRSCLQKTILKLCRVMRLQQLLRVLYCLQKISLLFAKFCCLLLHFFFSNKYFRKIFMASAYEEFSSVYRSGSRIEESSDYGKYFRALRNMQGENLAGLWIANRKSLGQVKKQMQKGENEGKKCSDLISLLIEKSSPDFSSEKFVKPQNDLFQRLEVEREIDVRKRSWKMTAISIIVVMVELSAFTHDEAEGITLLKRCIDACSQAWTVMEVVENNASETVEISKTADEIFEKLEKKRKWIEYSLPLSTPAEIRSPASAKAAIQNLVEKGKEIGNEYWSNKPSVAIAGYALYRIGRVSMDDDFNSVEDICDRLCGMLADVMGSCCVKAAGVIMEDCKKLATKADEESILKIARLAGKVKGVSESVGWTLKWNSDAESSSIKTSLAREETHALRRYPTFQTG